MTWRIAIEDEKNVPLGDKLQIVCRKNEQAIF